MRARKRFIKFACSTGDRRNNRSGIVLLTTATPGEDAVGTGLPFGEVTPELPPLPAFAPPLSVGEDSGRGVVLMVDVVVEVVVVVVVMMEGERGDRPGEVTTCGGFRVCCSSCCCFSCAFC